MKNFILLIFSLNSFGLFGNRSFVPHKYTVALKPGVNKFIEIKGANSSRIVESVQYLNVYQNLLSIKFKSDVSEKEEYDFLKYHPDILSYHKTVSMQNRGCNPNDSAYYAQYNMELMKFDEIWCFNTSGLSPSNDTLVVGAIDNGFSYWLNDILPNIFFNRLEIPDNGKDDDQNGYRDDYYGFNAELSSGDNHQADRHGTEVISVIGAKGNNKLGITGTNPNIKIILCSANDDAELVKCYHYFVKMKRDYLTSGGTKGAFIVSTNLSSGFDAFPDDLPLVCQSYDSLGSVGILNSVATINQGKNIDTEGDIPGLCPSPYLIVVTNTNRNDQKVQEAGFSNINVDIAASGESIPMSDISGNIVEESGCSFSSPHVAGAISLLYQFCPKITELNKSKPELAVSILRKIILDCGDHLTTLEGLTVSENRLNAYKALLCLNSFCLGDSIGGKNIELLNNFGGGPLELKFRPEFFGKYKLFIYNNLGQFVHSQTLEYAPNLDYHHFIDVDSWPSGVYHVYIEGFDLRWGGNLIKF